MRVGCGAISAVLSAPAGLTQRSRYAGTALLRGSAAGADSPGAVQPAASLPGRLRGRRQLRHRRQVSRPPPPPPLLRSIPAGRRLCSLLLLPGRSEQRALNRRAARTGAERWETRRRRRRSTAPGGDRTDRRRRGHRPRSAGRLCCDDGVWSAPGGGQMPAVTRQSERPPDLHMDGAARGSPTSTLCWLGDRCRRQTQPTRGAHPCRGAAPDAEWCSAAGGPDLQRRRPLRSPCGRPARLVPEGAGRRLQSAVQPGRPVHRRRMCRHAAAAHQPPL